MSLKCYCGKPIRQCKCGLYRAINGPVPAVLKITALTQVCDSHNPGTSIITVTFDTYDADFTDVNFMRWVDDETGWDMVDGWSIEGGTASGIVKTTTAAFQFADGPTRFKLKNSENDQEVSDEFTIDTVVCESQSGFRLSHSCANGGSLTIVVPQESYDALYDVILDGQFPLVDNQRPDLVGDEHVFSIQFGGQLPNGEHTISVQLHSDSSEVFADSFTASCS